MKHLYLIDTDKFLDFLEQEIEEGRNPSTQEEWEDTFIRFSKKHKPVYLGNTYDNYNVASALNSVGFNVANLNDLDKDQNEEPS